MNEEALSAFKSKPIGKVPDAAIAKHVMAQGLRIGYNVRKETAGVNSPELANEVAAAPVP